jgi:hypothetical protein
VADSSLVSGKECSMRPVFKVAAAACLLGAFGWFAAAAADHMRKSSQDHATSSAALSSGMVIAVDPETGELGMPTAAQLGREMSIEDAQAYARQIRSELLTINHPDGSSTLIHDERLADYAVIRIEPDGRKTFVCVHGEQAAHHAASCNVPVETGMEER